MREVVNPAAVVKEEPSLLARFAEFLQVLQGRGYAFHLFFLLTTIHQYVPNAEPITVFWRV